MSLWRADELLKATGGRNVRMEMPKEISGISIDTRSLQAGDAFFAIKGDQFDGHDFLSSAMRAGASVGVVSKEKLPALGALQMPLVVVSDVLKAMEDLGQAARARSRAKIVAVTGSAGKTTCKDVLCEVLGHFGRVHASPASFNNHWGVPLTLSRMPEDTQFAIFEIGMNHPGEIRPLTKLVKPHVCIITTIAAAHMGQFESLDAIAKAKAEIFEGLVSGGTAVIDGDIDQTKMLCENATQAGAGSVLTFGDGSHNHSRLTSHTLSASGSQFSALISGGALDVTLELSGRHQIQNMLGVLTVCDLFGVDLQDTAKHLSQIKPGQGRGETSRLKIDSGYFTLIDEAYNANPQAMEAMFDVLSRAQTGKGGRRVAIIGDMLELGEHSRALHLDLARAIKASRTDLVFSAGMEMKHLDNELDNGLRGGHVENVEKLIPLVTGALRAGDVVAIKASNGMKFGRMVAGLKKKFKPV